ncbi:PIN domain-containing protein [Halegenticoccus soli]|uniref:PIN domain-containing protein n=1 Tax=Halegenticoccus soli TaxID=1985678 RepID=UPI000C6D88D0|nr:PIN domain-containing protein [Halegenticoccus soli]
MPKNTYVETDVLLALAKNTDWLKERAERAVDGDEFELETSAYAYLEFLMLGERYDFDQGRVAVALMSMVPIRPDSDQELVLKAIEYQDEHGATAFDAFHAAVAETRGLPVLASDKAYDDFEVERFPLEPGEEDE